MIIITARNDLKSRMKNHLSRRKSISVLDVKSVLSIAGILM